MAKIWAFFARESFPVLAAVLGADFAALVSPVAGRWAVVAEWGSCERSGGRRAVLSQGPSHEGEWESRVASFELLADVVDCETPKGASNWIAAPLMPRAAEGDVLVVHLPPGQASPRICLCKVEREVGCRRTACAGGAASGRGDSPQGPRRTPDCAGWKPFWKSPASGTRPMKWSRCWFKMAEAATRLLQAPTAPASFLWDRPNHTLVGRPAFGHAQDGELRIPDDRGVRGPRDPDRRAAAGADAARERRRADQPPGRCAKCHYQTQARCLCVPLRGRSGRVVRGVRAHQQTEPARFTKPRTKSALIGTGRARRGGAWRTRRTASSLLSDQPTRSPIRRPKSVRLIGNSPPIEALRSIVRRVADTDLAVLVLGENGTGKEVVAQSIHYLSRRARSAVHRGELCGDPRDAGRERAVRPRKGRVHRRPRGPAGQVRIGLRRYALPRRDRGPEPRQPGQAAARARGKGVGARWAVQRRFTPTPGSWRPRIRIWASWSVPRSSARTCSSVSTW